MSGFPFHVAGGSFGGGHSLLAEAMTPPALPKAQVAVGSRRRKLWEISHKFHCPIVGVCFECDELRRLMHKVMHLPRDASDFMLHTTAVGACEERSRLAEILQKSLEKRYQLSIRQLAACKSVAELRRAWRPPAAPSATSRPSSGRAGRIRAATSSSTRKSTATST